MPLETADTFEQLDDTYPFSGDPLSPGREHIRLLKSVLKKVFAGTGGNGFNIPITATEVEINHLVGVTSNVLTQIATLQSTGVPLTGIMLYSGAFAAIPSGYQLCDGTNGTPDLTDKFVYGTSVEAAIGDTGGSDISALLSHSHTFSHSHNGSTSSAGSHSHTIPMATASAIGFPENYSGSNPGGTPASLTSSSAGTHTHAVTVDTVNLTTSTDGGGSGVGQNIPKYIKLAYITRTS